MPKLYVVTTELEALVLADSPEAARQLADRQRIAHDILNGQMSDDWTAVEASHLPGGYEGEADLVYHGLEGRDVTVAEACEIAKAAGQTRFPLVRFCERH